jgi:hypothetical protein
MNHAKVVGLPYRVKCVATENSVDLTLLFYFDIFFLFLQVGTTQLR